MLLWMGGGGLYMFVCGYIKKLYYMYDDILMLYDIKRYEMHWDMNMQLVTRPNPITPDYVSLLSVEELGSKLIWPLRVCTH